MSELVYLIEIWYTYYFLSLAFNQLVIPPRLQAFQGLDNVIAEGVPV